MTPQACLVSCLQHRRAPQLSQSSIFTYGSLYQRREKCNANLICLESYHPVCGK